MAQLNITLNQDSVDSFRIKMYNILIHSSGLLDLDLV